MDWRGVGTSSMGVLLSDSVKTGDQALIQAAVSSFAAPSAGNDLHFGASPYAADIRDYSVSKGADLACGDEP